MNQIRVEDGIVVYYGNRAGKVEDGCAIVDPMFKGQEMDRFLETNPGIREIKWMDGMFDRLSAAGSGKETMQALKNIRVWQLKPDVDVHMKFIGYDEMCKRFGPPDRKNYLAVYDGAAGTNDLEALYMKFNTEQPAGHKGHSLSMSDILELYDETGSTFYYVDRIGFREVEFAAQRGQIQAMQL